MQRCRELRQTATDAEELLWGLIRDRQLCGAKFRRQHPGGPFVLDFYCHEAKLAVELDGGVHTDPVQAHQRCRTGQGFGGGRYQGASFLES
ncbi:MAG: endonuclease domain-containing protein [Firmicutes bacterium]|nr:endonuclease domain-containing protein [Bacillota bacterium]